QDYKQPGKYYPFATNRQYYLMYANTTEVETPLDTLEKITTFFKIENATDKEALLQRLLKENDIYEPMRRKITEDEKVELEKMNLAGIHFVPEIWRYYPENNIGSHILGFVGYTDDGYTGQYGLEGYFNKELSGQTGYLQYNRDAIGRIIPTADLTFDRPEDGFDLLLTIDRAVQFYTCGMLEKHAVKYGAERGTVIIMEPNTGAIIAMCSYPDFDPNNYNLVDDLYVYNNPAVYDSYEPGSVFKAITMAVALDQEKVTPDTMFEDKGEVTIANFTIRNALNKVYGRQNMKQVLENSINTGAIWVAQQVGREKFREYLTNFGFGSQTGISLHGEASGNISALNQKSDIYMATASFGQGITATPIQLLSAFAALANGGKLMKPYIVDKILFESGMSEQNKPTMIRQVISPKTSLTISAMLGSVVESGHAQRAAVDGYYIGGKTGTAQVSNPGTGKYYEDKWIHTFLGFAPISNPKFVMLTKFDHPTNVRFADSSAAPLFGEIAKFLLSYLQVPTEK
ncbi:MAG: penicillin-binding protein 2, partial [Candidatus Komeilibacteria bacterium]|nr:penicillin-binding protein 2 [Candidatus Komeilibacteria bacterium]